MPLLRWKEKDGISVTCADCEFVKDCDDVPEDYGVCAGFESRWEGIESLPEILADKKSEGKK